MAKRTTSSSKSKKSSRNATPKAAVKEAPLAAAMPVAVEPNAVVDAPEVEAAAAAPTREQIAHRAFEIFLRRGGGHGRHLEDWLEAERELGCRAA